MSEYSYGDRDPMVWQSHVEMERARKHRRENPQARYEPRYGPWQPFYGPVRRVIDPSIDIMALFDAAVAVCEE